MTCCKGKRGSNQVQAESTTNKAAGGCSYYSHVSVLLKLYVFVISKSAAEIVFLLYLVIIIKEVNNDV